MRFAKVVRVEDHSELAFALALKPVFLRSKTREKSGNGGEAEQERTLLGWPHLARDLEVHNNLQLFTTPIWYFYTKSRFYLQDLAKGWLLLINTALLFKREIKIEINWQSTHSCTLRFIVQCRNRNSLFYALARVPQIYRSWIDRPVTQGNPAKRCHSHGSQKPTKVTTKKRESLQCEHGDPSSMHRAFLSDCFPGSGNLKSASSPRKTASCLYATLGCWTWPEPYLFLLLQKGHELSFWHQIWVSRWTPCDHILSIAGGSSRLQCFLPVPCSYIYCCVAWICLHGHVGKGSCSLRNSV